MSNPSPGAASTTPKRRQRTQALPVSATVAKLIGQIQTEAEAAMLAALSAKDGILVLQPLDSKSGRFRDHGDIGIFEDLGGAEVRWYRNRHCPESWVDSRLGAEWHPSHHDVHATRLDGQGREWSTCLGTFITDDYGDLVEVQR